MMVRIWLYRFNFIRAQTPAPLDSAEALASSAVQMALDMKAKAIVCFTASGRAAPLLSKYRPTMPVLVVSADSAVVRAARSQFGLLGVPMQFDGLEVRPRYCRWSCWQRSFWQRRCSSSLSCISRKLRIIMSSFG